MRQTYGQKVAARLVTVGVHSSGTPYDSPIYGLYINGQFLGPAATKSMIEARAESLRAIIAREIDAARKLGRNQERYRQYNEANGTNKASREAVRKRRKLGLGEVKNA